MSNTQYVHGYSGREKTRLNDQADTLENLIHNDTLFPESSHVLEAGCGVGAQTKIIAAKNPGASIISVDISGESLHEAEKMIETNNIKNVELQQADIYHLPFEDETFDVVIVCFVLEHLPKPTEALLELKRVLKKGGTIMVIEGDHGSTIFYPDSTFATKAIECQIELQSKNGGNSNIGRELYPLLQSSEFSNIQVTPRMVYVDASKPHLVEGFTKNTFTAMIEGVRENALNDGIISGADFDRGIRDLYRTTESDGVFCYTFFKGFGKKA